MPLTPWLEKTSPAPGDSACHSPAHTMVAQVNLQMVASGHNAHNPCCQDDGCLRSGDCCTCKQHVAPVQSSGMTDGRSQDMFTSLLGNAMHDCLCSALRK